MYPQHCDTLLSSPYCRFAHMCLLCIRQDWETLSSPGTGHWLWGIECLSAVSPRHWLWALRPPLQWAPGTGCASSSAVSPRHKVVGHWVYLLCSEPQALAVGTEKLLCSEPQLRQGTEYTSSAVSLHCSWLNHNSYHFTFVWRKSTQYGLECIKFLQCVVHAYSCMLVYSIYCE